MTHHTTEEEGKHTNRTHHCADRRRPGLARTLDVILAVLTLDTIIQLGVLATGVICALAALHTGG